jgi:hypothetical protein
MRADAPPLPQTYGMLIYRQLGANAQDEFAKTWGVGFALNNASEWQDVAITAAKAAVLLVILDMLRVTRNRPWLESHGALSFRVCLERAPG